MLKILMFRRSVIKNWESKQKKSTSTCIRCECFPINVRPMENKCRNEANRTFYAVIRVAPKYTEFLINGRIVRALARKSVKISWLIQFRTGKKLCFFTQLFNLIGRKRLRSPNSKCACATVKRLGMSKETFSVGGLYPKAWQWGFTRFFPNRFWN